MKKKRKQYFPRAVLKNLVQDIVRLVRTDEGRIVSLELLEEIPYELRPEMVEGLSSFYEKELVWFFHLLKLEYGRELETYCDRALEKYKMAGIDTSQPDFFKGTFYKAYATCTRHTSRITVDVAWDTGGDGVHVEGFYLTFSQDGIYSFFVVDNMSIEQYETDREVLSEMVELNFLQTCQLIQEAYNFNVLNMSRPALGKYLYNKYLEIDSGIDQHQHRELLHRLSEKLTPRQVVNSLFHALRCRDVHYINSLWPEHRLAGRINIGNLSSLLLEGQVKEVHGSRDLVEVLAYIVNMADRQVYRSEYKIELYRDITFRWLIVNMRRIRQEKISSVSKLNPFNNHVFCRVYEITAMDELFEILDRVDNIREVEELPYGMHMRVTSLEDDFNHGISLLSGVIADLVVNGEEFVVIAHDKKTVMDFDKLLASNYINPTEFLGEYEVNLIEAFNYLAGQYINFEDVLINHDSGLAFEDGMKFLTARYLVKDRRQVLARLNMLANREIKLSDGMQIFYQTEDNLDELVFMAEYILGNSWVTLSTFGEKDLNEVRQDFENKMFNCLEFDGLEVREEGIFEILTNEVKKQYPDLEAYIKELYLNKWYNSQLTVLRGMSPSEASQTEEGTRLLWTMFKKIKQKEKRRIRSGDTNQIDLKEYIRKVDLKKEEK